MTTADPTAFEDLSNQEAVARLDCLLEKLEAERNRPRSPVKHRRTGRPHTAGTKRKLAKQMFERRRAQTLLASPSAVAKLRLAADLSQRQASEKALIDERTWTRAEANFSAVSALTQRRVARALGVNPANLR